MRGQAARDLLLELRPVAARNHCNVRNGEKLGQRAGHLLREGLLTLGERAVEVECDQLLHLGFVSACLNSNGGRAGNIRLLRGLIGKGADARAQKGATPWVSPSIA